MHPSYVPILDFSGHFVHPGMTRFGLNPDYLQALRQAPVQIIERGPCPDCQGEMRLRLGRYGRYYQCTDSRCPGRCSATLTGAYATRPVAQALRALRRQVMVAREVLIEDGVPVDELMLKQFGPNFRDTTEEQCHEHLAFLRTLTTQAAIDQILDAPDEDNRHTMKYYVTYRALGKDAEAGPYTAESLQSHRDDIAGYEGVSNVRVISEEEHRLRKRDRLAPGALDQILADDDDGE